MDYFTLKQILEDVYPNASKKDHDKGASKIMQLLIRGGKPKKEDEFCKCKEQWGRYYAASKWRCENCNKPIRT